MKQIKETPNTATWPRRNVPSVECRKRDLVIRITNWMDDEEEPAYDVETYIGGVYDYNESDVISRWRPDGERRRTPQECKDRAIAYAQAQIAKLL